MCLELAWRTASSHTQTTAFQQFTQHRASSQALQAYGQACMHSPNSWVRMTGKY
jgi:hypothetical protein